MDLKLKGKAALVMGASSGLGYAVAQSLVSEGARVAICSRDEGRIKKAALGIGAELAIASDLSRPGACKTLISAVERELGSLDVLVVNAGGPPKGDFMDITQDMWKDGFQS